MTFPTQLSETPATGNPTRTNEALDTLHALATYLKRHAATTGLTWAYWGGRWGGFSVADGTLTLTNAADNYVVVLRSTGVISVSTATTNWNDSTNYARVYKITTAGSVVTAVEPHYAGPGGVHGSAASAGAGTELRGLTFTSDTGSTADSDPGAGLFKWNNATQGSATKLFIDEATADAVNLDTLFANLSTGFLFIQQSDDADRWQMWEFTAVVDDTGYYDVAVALQGKGADIEDGKLCYFDFDSDVAGGGAVSSVNGATGAVSLNAGYIGVKGADIASAGTVDLAAATGDFVDVTGTTTITAFGTLAAGTFRVVRFTGALTLTHNATSLILPGGANITTAAGDVASLRSLGSGNWVCVVYSKANGQAVASGGGGLTNWTDGLNSSSPNTTTPVASFTATNAATDVDAAIIAKGAGAILAQIPDNTTTGGNKRGVRAVDLQMSRSGAAQVASGTEAVAMGENNTASGTNTVAIGQTNSATQANAIAVGDNNTASGIGAHAFGSNNTASATYAHAIGRSNTASANSAFAAGNSNTASGDQSVALGTGGIAAGDQAFTYGSGARTRSVNGSMARGGRPLSTNGDNQQRECGYAIVTTNNTTTRLTSDASASANTNQLGLPVRFAAAFYALVTAHEPSTNDSAAWIVQGACKRTTGGTFSLLGTPTVTALGADAGAAAWTLAIVADDTNKVVGFNVTGETSKTIRWAAGIYWNEVGQ